MATSYYLPYSSSTKPKDMWANARDLARYYGQMGENTFGTDYEEDRAAGNWYRNRGDELFGNLLENPGYSEDEIRSILDQEGLAGGLPSDEDYAGNYLTPWEEEQMYGDTASRVGLFDPQMTEDLEQQKANRVREGLRSTEAGMRGAFQGGAARGREALGAYGTAARGALSRGGERSRGVLERGTSDLRATLDPSQLDFTDEDLALLRDRAGRLVGGEYGQSRDEVLRRALIQGDAGNPLAVASALGRLDHQRSIDAADAMTDAELKGREAQRGARRDIATLRGEMEKGILDRALGLEDTLGGRELTLEGQLGEAGLGLENSLRGEEVGMEGRLGENLTGTEYKLGSDLQSSHQGDVDRSIDIRRDIDNTSAARAGDIARNRQTVNLQNQGDRYNRAMQQSQERSKRAQQVADTRRADKLTAMGYYPEQQKTMMTGAQNQAQNRLQSGQIAVQGATSAAQGMSSWEQRPKFWQQLVGAGIGAVGGMFGK